MDMDDSPLVTAGLPGCPYRITSYTGTALGHESGVWLTAPPSAVPGIHRCTGVGSPVVPLTVVLGGTVGRRVCHGSGVQPTTGRWPNDVKSSDSLTVCYVVASEMMSIGLGSVVFPAEEIADLSTTQRSPRSAKYMAAMGLWCPQTGPGDPGPVPTSSCGSCMKCEFCFPGVRLPPE